MLALIVSFSTNACCGTYAHRPYTSTVPAVQAISESNALHNDDFPEPTCRTKVSGWWKLGLGLGTGEVIYLAYDNHQLALVQLKGHITQLKCVHL